MALCSHHGGSVYISYSDNIRCGFDSHLCAWLRREEIAITNDRAFSAGTLTKLAREDAIRKSNIVIIIISEEYPSSKHCLDEVEMILKYGEKKEILPVFYYIKSEDIRYQTGSFENAFIELGSKFPEQMVKIWRNGFEEVAAKAAYRVNIDRDESKIVQDITRDVSSKMKCVCSLDAQGLNDAILQPTTTHHTSPIPVSGGLSKKKQIADVKVDKIPLRPQVGRRSEEPPENLVHGKLPSKKIHRPELHRGQVTEEDASHHHKSGSTNGTYVRNPSSCNVKKAASCRISLVPSVSVADAVSPTHMLINVQKMLSCYNRTASTSSSFSGVNHDVDQQTLAKDSVPSQSCLKIIRTALNTMREADCLSHGFFGLQDFECLETLKSSLSDLSGLGPEEGISNETKVAIELIADMFKRMQERFEAVENALDKAFKLDFEKEQARYDCQQYRCRFRKLGAKKKILDEKETELEGKQLLLRNQLRDVQAKLQQNQGIGVVLLKEMRRCYDFAEGQKEVMNKCCEELQKLQPSIDVAEKRKADVEATMEKLRIKLAEIEKQPHGSNGRFHLP